MAPKKATKPKNAAKTRNTKPGVAITAASTRPRRASTTKADAQPVPKKAKIESSTMTTSKPKQANVIKSKGPKTVTPANTSKPRGRPPKIAKEETRRGAQENTESEDVDAKPLPKKRGRPSNSTAPTSTPSKKTTKPNSASSRAKIVDQSNSGSGSKDDGHPVPSRGTGRPSTKNPIQTSAQTKKAQSDPKKRSAATRNDDEAKAEGQVDVEEPPPKRQRGRPSKKPVDDDVEDDHVAQGGASYWLMKAEPESRLEKGVDVKFSIDDLQASEEPEPWNGVRNHVAKNNMKAMKKGEQAFFYHSNCKTPGIVGIMEIVEEASPDESAFDEKDPYYDPKAKRENPNGWVIVRVEFRQKFDNPVTLGQLRNLAKENEDIANMQLLKQSRLSVSRVLPAEWNFILERAGVDSVQAKIDEPGKLFEHQPEVNGEDVESTLPAFENANHVSNPGPRATSVPPTADGKLAPSKKTGSRPGSRARSVPPSASTAETGPAGLQTETPISQAMARVVEEPEI